MSVKNSVSTSSPVPVPVPVSVPVSVPVPALDTLNKSNLQLIKFNQIKGPNHCKFYLSNAFYSWIADDGTFTASNGYRIACGDFHVPRFNVHNKSLYFNSEYRGKVGTMTQGLEELQKAFDKLLVAADEALTDARKSVEGKSEGSDLKWVGGATGVDTHLMKFGYRGENPYSTYEFFIPSGIYDWVGKLPKLGVLVGHPGFVAENGVVIACGGDWRPGYVASETYSKFFIDNFKGIDKILDPNLDNRWIHIGRDYEKLLDAFLQLEKAYLADIENKAVKEFNKCFTAMSIDKKKQIISSLVNSILSGEEEKK